MVQFVYLGEFGDTFGPGKHTLTTDNIPVLTKLKSWKYGFNSPFKADVYYVNTRLFTGNKWGTANPIMMRDDDLGIVRVRAFGTFDFRDRRSEAVPEGSRRLGPELPARRVRRHHALAHRQPVRRRAGDGEDPGVRRRQPLHRARRGAAAADQPGHQAKYGLEMPSFILENVSVPPEVEQAIDKRSSMAAVGNLNDYVKFQMAQGMEKGGSAGGVGDRDGGRPRDGAADDAAAGDAGRRRAKPAAGGRGRASGPARLPATSPTRSRSRKADVLAILESGELAGEEDRLDLAHQALRARRVPREVGGSEVGSIGRHADPNWPISELTALEKHPCPACGAQAEWNPAQQKLVCPFCGTESPFTVDRRPARSRSSISCARCARCRTMTRGWQTEKRTVQCQSCKAVSVFDPQRVGQRCEFCGSPELVDYQEIKSPIRPQSLLPFKVAETAVREQIRRGTRASGSRPAT